MPTLEEIVKNRIVYAVPGMDRVKVQNDLTYRTVGESALKLDLYTPEHPDTPRAPCVVLVHGGPVPEGSNAKKMGVFVSTGQLLAASGMVAVAFNHRWYGPPRLKDAAGDIAALVDHIRARADAAGIDPDRLALWCYSGGGPFLSPWLAERPSFLRCVVAYYALLDLQVPAEGVPDQLGDELRREYSPLRHLGAGDRKLPPLLVARAGRDNPWLNGGIDRFVAEALARNAPLDLLNHPDGQHGFDVLDDDARSREIIRRTIDFVQAHLR